jgi:hypothetical protein
LSCEATNDCEYNRFLGAKIGFGPREIFNTNWKDVRVKFVCVAMLSACVLLSCTQSGSTGPQGAPGPQGEPGPQGVAGPQGTSGTNATSATGNLWISRLNPDAGSPCSGGGVAIVSEDGGRVVVCDGANGAVGLRGEVGAVGPKGDTGAAGVAGAQGMKGDVGPQGLVGLQGVVGLKGEQGNVGPAGAQGPQGLAGAAGPQGPPGEGGSLFHFAGSSGSSRIDLPFNGAKKCFALGGLSTGVSPSGEVSLDISEVSMPVGASCSRVAFYGALSEAPREAVGLEAQLTVLRETKSLVEGSELVDFSLCEFNPSAPQGGVGEALCRGESDVKVAPFDQLALCFRASFKGASSLRGSWSVRCVSP